MFLLFNFKKDLFSQFGPMKKCRIDYDQLGRSYVIIFKKQTKIFYKLVFFERISEIKFKFFAFFHLAFLKVTFFMFRALPLFNMKNMSTLKRLLVNITVQINNFFPI